MYSNQKTPDFSYFIRQRPSAYAYISGSEQYPKITGLAKFHQTNSGVIVSVNISGLPSPHKVCGSPIFGMHIHDGKSCTGNEKDPFADAMTHYNPDNCPHPYHAGDLPPLFGANGYAFSSFLTDRFSVKQIIGKTIIIHSSPDDFTTQPAGNSGKKIACGVIKSSNRTRF